jgi:Rieske Fe-S protein
MASQNPSEANNRRSEPDAGRRRFILFVPFAVGAGILTMLVSAAARFLRPQVGTNSDAGWLPVAQVSELTGTQPIARDLNVQQELGWTQVLETHPVIILPQQQRVLSAVCPHEGCTVSWHGEVSEFLCPCHDSHFDPTGARKSGPAARGLDALPTQVENGVLKVRWPTNEQLPPARG